MEQDATKDFNKVSEMTARCRATRNWFSDYSDTLVVGETYKVTYIAVLRSKTLIMLDNFGDKVFDQSCFDLYEKGYLTDPSRDYKYIAPSIRQLIEEVKTKYGIRKIKNNKGTIIPHLKDIEHEHGVTVLFASLAGSRLWGLESEESDWDVRFIYIHTSMYYKVRETSEENIVKAYADNVELTGWDLKHFMTQLANGNPVCHEILSARTLYTNNQPYLVTMKDLAEHYFQSMNAFHYYLGLYLVNERFFEGGEAPLKKVLFALCGILSCIWIETNKNFPPTDVDALLDGTGVAIRHYNLIKDLVAKKRDGKIDNILVNRNLLNFIKGMADHYKSVVGTYKPRKSLEEFPDLQDLFQQIIFEK